MNKLRAYFRVICAPIRSWSDILAQHFPSLPAGELCFWRPEISSQRPEISSRRPEISSRWPEILYRLIIFLCDIFSGARGMLKSLRNHRQSQRPNGKTWRIVGGRCWEKIVFHGHSIDCSYVCTSKQVGLEVNTIIEDVRGWRNSKRIELLSSDDPTPSSQIGWAAPCECNTRMRDPKCSR